MLLDFLAYFEKEREGKRGEGRGREDEWILPSRGFDALHILSELSVHGLNDTHIPETLLFYGFLSLISSHLVSSHVPVSRLNLVPSHISLHAVSSRLI